MSGFGMIFQCLREHLGNDFESLHGLGVGQDMMNRVKDAVQAVCFARRGICEIHIFWDMMRATWAAEEIPPQARL